MARKKTLKFDRVFTKVGVDPYGEDWETRDILLPGKDDVIIFKQDGVECPKSWSEKAVYMAASKYFRGNAGSPDRENSIKQLFNRVANTITAKGVEYGYFTNKQSEIFSDELKAILIQQRGAFNSPVFFNVGAVEEPQGSACFILKVEDDLRSIVELQTAECMLFSQGSGMGVNLSNIREAGAPLSRGGQASGPISYTRAYNSWAGIIKSAGVQRRAAMFIRLNDRHPDVWNGLNNGTDFITYKAHEEKKAWTLIDAGYSGEFQGEAYETISGQNANLSVGISDDFMRAAINGLDWSTHGVLTNDVVRTFPANDMLKAMAEGAWLCGDPGVQFDDRINEWNTCSRSGRINSSNPCSEFLFLDNSACNLFSLNLLKFFKSDMWDFNDAEFSHAVRIAIIAQDILVEMSGYPTEEITVMSKRFRPLGLGFCNIGGSLMAMGIPYDSDEGRLWASTLTALMTGTAYMASAEMADILGPFEAYKLNKVPMNSVLKQHRELVIDLNAERQDPELVRLVSKAKDWWRALGLVKEGFRNAQTTLMAPTGTISFLMDSATQGIEPAIVLIGEKKLSSGGTIPMSTDTVEPGLRSLGYSEPEISHILKLLVETKNQEKAGIKEPHLSVFDATYPSINSKRFISVSGHLKMMAAVQPFISGAISKTVGVPRQATAQEIREVFIMAWKLGLKSVSIYRSGSKRVQPLECSDNGEPDRKKAAKSPLPETRMAHTHKFDIGGQEGFITVGFYDDMRVGEVFLQLAKEGATVNGFAAVLGRAISAGLQRGVPLQVYISQLINTTFAPQGFTPNKAIKTCHSVPDYLAKFLTTYDDPTHMLKEKTEALACLEKEDEPKPMGNLELYPMYEVCPNCGNLARKIGLCLRCDHCGHDGSCG